MEIKKLIKKLRRKIIWGTVKAHKSVAKAHKLGPKAQNPKGRKNSDVKGNIKKIKSKNINSNATH